jgi:hypothetical protein
VSPYLEIPATKLTDLAWVRAQIGGAAKLYDCARQEVLGTIWWYSLSSVLVAPALESLVATGTALDPALEAITLELVADGRFAGARSSRALSGDLTDVGSALGKALGPVITTIATATGAHAPALGAIATDSIGNRLLWAGSAAGDVDRAMGLAGPLVAATDLGMPKPRFVRVGSTPAVRRASCCLIYEANSPKCASCPRQTPAERDRRLRAVLG